jgi:hypothetical protein
VKDVIAFVTKKVVIKEIVEAVERTLKEVMLIETSPEGPNELN